MDQKMMIHLEVVKNERTYRMELPVGGSYGEAYDAATEMLAAIVDMSKQAVEQAKQKKVEEPTAN